MDEKSRGYGVDRSAPMRVRTLHYRTARTSSNAQTEYYCVSVWVAGYSKWHHRLGTEEGDDIGHQINEWNNHNNNSQCCLAFSCRRDCTNGLGPKSSTATSTAVCPSISPHKNITTLRTPASGKSNAMAGKPKDRLTGAQDSEVKYFLS